MNTFDLSLDLNKGRNVNPVRIRQGDLNGTTIKALIFDHGAAADLSGLTARWVMRLPDGTEYYRKTATVDATAGTVEVLVDETQAASVTGRTRGYFQLLQGSSVIASTGDVLVEVLPDALEGATVAESYDSAIQDAIDALDAAVEAIPDTVEDVLDAHPEWVTTVQDGAISEAKLAPDLAGDRARLLCRLDNLLTAALPEGDAATATDAARTPMAGLALYGRSTQDGTPTPSSPVPIVSVGGNLLPNNGSSTTSYGVTFTVNDDGSVTCSGTNTSSSPVHFNIVNGRGTEKLRLPDGTYTLWAWQDGYGVSNTYLSLMKNSAYVAQDVLRVVGSNGCSVAAIEGYDYDAIHAGFFIAAGATVNATIRFALFEGDQSKGAGYVPYGCAGLWARGKNLLDTSIARGYTQSGITVSGPDADGWFTISGTSDATSAGVITMWGATDARIIPRGMYTLLLETEGTPFVASKVRLQAYGVREGDGATYMTDAGPYTMNYSENGIDRIGVHMASSSSGTTVNGRFRITLVSGTTAPTAYVPYAESVTPIDLDGHELRSLPDGTRDEVTVDARGHAVLVQRVGSVDLGTLTWGLHSSGEYFYSSSLATLKAPGNFNLVCDHYQTSEISTVATMPDKRIKGSSENADMFIKDSSHSTAADLKASLDGVTMIYALATPVTHDLGTVDPVALQGPDLVAQAVPTAPFALTYERDLNVTLARLEAAIAALA